MHRSWEEIPERYRENPDEDDKRLRLDFSIPAERLHTLAHNIEAFADGDLEIEGGHVAKYLSEMLTIIGELGGRLPCK